MEQHFFQSFFGPRVEQNPNEMPGYIIHNEYIIEITNNWIFVVDLIKRHYAGELQQVDNMEQTWLLFLSQNNIDITKYNNEEEFLQNNWRNP